MKCYVALAVLLAAFMRPAQARCASEFRLFSGAVNHANGTPAAGAAVGISWVELEGAAGPALAISDAKGRYQVPLYFNTYSGKGKVYEDECEFRVQRVSVSAYRTGMRSQHRQVRVGRARNTALPTLWLTLPQDREPVVSLIRPGG